MSKVILHIDLNAFFVRCEEIKNPKLEGKPVIIGRLGRSGIVSTCSYAARKCGVHSGMPTFQAVQLCPTAIMIGGDYHYYNEMSHRFFDYLRQFFKLIEVASVDECYIDATNQLKGLKNPQKYFEDLRDGLFQQTKLKCSIGVAPTKFLAKMASDMKKPMGITIIHRKDARDKLAPLPIESFFGIGKKTSPRLKAMGINTIGDLGKRIDEKDLSIQKALGKFYYVIEQWINGEGNDVVEVEPWDPKSIGNSHTTSRDISDPLEIKEEIAKLAKEVSDRAKYHRKVGKRVQLVIKDANFKTTNHSGTLSEPTCEYEIIRDKAFRLLDQYYDGREIRLVGVTLQDLNEKDKEPLQMSIFDNLKEIEEKCATKLLVAELNRKMKKGVFKIASESLEEKHR